eukprot:m.62463 g.62463  ORF g.62463 m.62463 type:complete len:53 (-) comp7403_c0_seq1:560-718(-)
MRHPAEKEISTLLPQESAFGVLALRDFVSVPGNIDAGSDRLVGTTPEATSSS